MCWSRLLNDLKRGSVCLLYLSSRLLLLSAKQNLNSISAFHKFQLSINSPSDQKRNPCAAAQRSPAFDLEQMRHPTFLLQDLKPPPKKNEKETPPTKTHWHSTQKREAKESHEIIWNKGGRNAQPALGQIERSRWAAISRTNSHPRGCSECQPATLWSGKLKTR